MVGQILIVHGDLEVKNRDPRFTQLVQARHRV